jgi:YVTN family beta-propeller protein
VRAPRAAEALGTRGVSHKANGSQQTLPAVSASPPAVSVPAVPVASVGAVNPAAAAGEATPGNVVVASVTARSAPLTASRVLKSFPTTDQLPSPPLLGGLHNAVQKFFIDFSDLVRTLPAGPLHQLGVNLEGALLMVRKRLFNQAPTFAPVQLTYSRTKITGKINGYDADGDHFTYSVVGSPALGTVTLAEDGGYIYTPSGDFAGSDSFTIQITSKSSGINLLRPQAPGFGEWFSAFPARSSLVEYATPGLPGMFAPIPFPRTGGAISTEVTIQVGDNAPRNPFASSSTSGTPTTGSVAPSALFLPGVTASVSVRKTSSGQPSGSVTLTLPDDTAVSWMNNSQTGDMSLADAVALWKTVAAGSGDISFGVDFTDVDNNPLTVILDQVTATKGSAANTYVFSGTLVDPNAADRTGVDSIFDITGSQAKNGYAAFRTSYVDIPNFSAVRLNVANADIYADSYSVGQYAATMQGNPEMTAGGSIAAKAAPGNAAKMQGIPELTAGGGVAATAGQAPSTSTANSTSNGVYALVDDGEGGYYAGIGDGRVEHYTIDGTRVVLATNAWNSPVTTMIPFGGVTVPIYGAVTSQNATAIQVAQDAPLYAGQELAVPLDTLIDFSQVQDGCTATSSGSTSCSSMFGQLKLSGVTGQDEFYSFKVDQSGTVSFDAPQDARLGVSATWVAPIGSYAYLGGMGLALSPDGGRAYLANPNGFSVSVVDTASGVVTATSSLADPADVVVNPDGKTVYATNFFESSVSVLDAATGAVTGTIGGLDLPFAIAVSTLGDRVYVADLNGGVSVLNPVTKEVITTIDVGTPAGQAGAGASNVVTSPYSAQPVYAVSHDGGFVSVISPGTNKVTKTLELSGRPDGLAISPQGDYLYVTSEQSNAVWVFHNPGSANPTLTTLTGFDAPSGVAVSPDGKRLYVTNSAAGTMSVLSVGPTGTNSVIQTLEVGANPPDVAVSPDGTRVFIANDSGLSEFVQVPTPVSGHIVSPTDGTNSSMVVSFDTNLYSGSVTAGTAGPAGPQAGPGLQLSYSVVTGDYTQTGLVVGLGDGSLHQWTPSADSNTDPGSWTSLNSSFVNTSVNTLTPVGESFVAGLSNGVVEEWTGSGWTVLADGSNWSSNHDAIPHAAIPYADGFVLALKNGAIEQWTGGRWKELADEKNGDIYYDPSAPQGQTMIRFGDSFVVGQVDGAVVQYTPNADGSFSSEVLRVADTNYGRLAVADYMTVTAIVAYADGFVIGDRGGSVRQFSPGATGQGQKNYVDSRWTLSKPGTSSSDNGGVNVVSAYANGLVVGRNYNKPTADYLVESWDGVASTGYLGGGLPDWRGLAHAKTGSQDGWDSSVKSIVSVGINFFVGLSDGSIQKWDGLTGQFSEVRGSGFKPDGATLAATYAFVMNGSPGREAIDDTGLLTWEAGLDLGVLGYNFNTVDVGPNSNEILGANDPIFGGNNGIAPRCATDASCDGTVYTWAVGTPPSYWLYDKSLNTDPGKGADIYRSCGNAGLCFSVDAGYMTYGYAFVPNGLWPKLNPAAYRLGMVSALTVGPAIRANLANGWGGGVNNASYQLASVEKGIPYYTEFGEFGVYATLSGDIGLSLSSRDPAQEALKGFVYTTPFLGFNYCGNNKKTGGCTPALFAGATDVVDFADWKTINGFDIKPSVSLAVTARYGIWAPDSIKKIPLAGDTLADLLRGYIYLGVQDKEIVDLRVQGNSASVSLTNAASVIYGIQPPSFNDQPSKIRGAFPIWSSDQVTYTF